MDVSWIVLIKILVVRDPACCHVAPQKRANERGFYLFSPPVSRSSPSFVHKALIVFAGHETSFTHFTSVSHFGKITRVILKAFRPLSIPYGFVYRENDLNIARVVSSTLLWIIQRFGLEFYFNGILIHSHVRLVVVQCKSTAENITVKYQRKNHFWNNKFLVFVYYKLLLVSNLCILKLY